MQGGESGWTEAISAFLLPTTAPKRMGRVCSGISKAEIKAGLHLAAVDNQDITWVSAPPSTGGWWWSQALYKAEELQMKSSGQAQPFFSPACH